MVSKTRENRCFNEAKVKKLKKLIPDTPTLENRTDEFKALAHPGRLAILRLLADQDCCVCDLTHALDLPVSTVSQNLNILKKANWISSRQKGKFVHYSLIKEIP